MTMTALIQKPRHAVFGQPTNFVLTVSNSGASPVNVNSISVTVTNPDGKLATACTVGPVVTPTGTGLAAVGGYQFNVQVPASGSYVFPFDCQFFGSGIAGSPAEPQPTFVVSANILDSTGTTFSPPQLSVNLNRPVFGTPPGAPPNQVPSNFGAVDFSTPKNSGLLL